ncbi:H-type small acid-soluble spore protein [Lederbergia sp. NSJ-179]|uniref:H-type small acid-soluble spore protein n=1 Tax=Lederbergia sp. NSJ-179 TaxID=2931402 RepID=UPI001FD3B352|nr:H-type small acid-soluble spore protein [Lederbergia sp. NSJ-179]MCJ7840271.1 H-type small acid-soluble spore protein [Lederbergia sp. NSJ-179]
MDVKRLKQILSSSSEIDVNYNGVSVWIDSLNDDGETATVHLLDPPQLEGKSIVKITELEEV